MTTKRVNCKRDCGRRTKNPDGICRICESQTVPRARDMARNAHYECLGGHTDSLKLLRKAWK